MKPELKEALQGVDWLRVAQRLSTLARAVRGDGAQLRDDLRADNSAADNLRRKLQSVARESFNCRAPAACACPLCLREGT